MAIKVDTTFTTSVLVKNIPYEKLDLFLSLFIKQTWQSKNVPDSQRTVGDPKKLTLSMLPHNYNIEKVAQQAVKRGLLVINQIGNIIMDIDAMITFYQPTNSYIVQINKVKFESYGDLTLIPVVNETLKLMS